MYRPIGLIVMLLATLAWGTSTAWADEICANPTEKAAAKAELAKAQALFGAGKLNDAWNSVTKVDFTCVDTDALKKQIASARGAEAEKNGNLGEAIRWYDQGKDHTAAMRVINRASGDRSMDVGLIGAAIAYFHDKNDKAGEQKIKDIAKRNVEKQLAEEEKQWGTQLKASHNFLMGAKEWTTYAESGKDKVTARAQQRGDYFAKDDSRVALKKAIQYYFAGDLEQKIKEVKTKAAGLGKQMEAKGEAEAAADYYMIADQGDKADALTKQVEAAKAKAEEGRQKTFKKDQADLEKELGF